ncbi:hypothetical protein LNKW23_16560 [Paralimibaculum aggregatum]|uniref:Uncharacterized protein n=1 Tax=Paralimibaculum aggregatum TaxID=3036245 RepID=A0ABQ6LGK2_9RHOB|nr:hypothetical protein LNKW23_16560 [Limibaculum sp. NKW23]
MPTAPGGALGSGTSKTRLNRRHGRQRGTRQARHPRSGADAGIGLGQYAGTDHLLGGPRRKDALHTLALQSEAGAPANLSGQRLALVARCEGGRRAGRVVLVRAAGVVVGSIGSQIVFLHVQTSS